MTNGEMLDLFFEKNDFYLSESEIKLGLVPQRLRGDNAIFAIKIGRKLIAEEGRRITARHVRELEKFGRGDFDGSEGVSGAENSRSRCSRYGNRRIARRGE